MKIIDDDDGQVKRLGSRNGSAPVDPTLQALQGLTKAVERVKAAPPAIVLPGSDGREHDESMLLLKEISKGIAQLSKQLTKKPAPGKWHFEVIRNEAGHITSVEATK